jgi:hypothetical protein
MQNAGMPTFLEQHADKVVGALSCFDRVLLRGYLPLESGWTMAEFLRAKGVDRLKLKPFLLEQAERLKKHSFKVAKEAGRPCQYLTGHARKDELAQEIAKKDGVEHGLVCVFSVVEPCRSFSLVWKNRKTFIRPAKRQCLFLDYYFLDRELGQEEDLDLSNRRAQSVVEALAGRCRITGKLCTRWDLNPYGPI